MPSFPIRNADPTQSPAPSMAAGGHRAVIAHACSAIARSSSPTLAIVLETTGSTYVATGAIALFDAHSQTGWLSGGCLEPEIARRAALAGSNETIDWMEVDTRDDAALFAGNALGCRGRLRLALLPLRALAGWAALGDRWMDRNGPMDFSIAGDGTVRCQVGDEIRDWNLSVAQIDWESGQHPESNWNVRIDAPPCVAIYGVGPEAPLLLPLLRSMGWITLAIEQRQRWIGIASLADDLCQQAPAGTQAILTAQKPFAALVMHHSFELDLDALLALSERPPPYIGLLGPQQRREDLFGLLPEPVRKRLLPSLHSPVGMDLGGRGPEAIALSIAAQLHSGWHGRQPGYT